MKKPALALLLLFISLSGLWAQTTPPDPKMTSSQFDMTGFPQWARDLRRGEIVAFGSFPFAYFFTNFGVDLYRCGTNGWDRRYAPWPFDAPGSVDKTKQQRIMTIGIAAGGAVLIALVDFGIEMYKRYKIEKDIRNLPQGTPIIIRKPLNEGDTETPENAAAPSTGSP